MAEYSYLKDEDVSGKTVVIRVDLNSNVEDGELFESARIEKHAETMKTVSGRNARLVVLAHQGRKGQDDCISLKQHAEFLSERIEKEVRLVQWDSDYLGEIKAMQPGDIILMENVRFHDNEEQDFSREEAAKVDWVEKIASASQLFVQDTLSVCHRPQPSVIGFTALLPSLVGPVLESELKALEHFDRGEKPCVFILGGSKVRDSINLINELFGKQKADCVCAGGLLGELFLKAQGKALGEKDNYFEEKGLLDLVEPAKLILDNHQGKVILPVDLAMMNDYDEREEISLEELPKDNMIYDIGMETVSEFKAALKGAKLVVMNGPMGVFEKLEFEVGTKKVLDAVSKARAFSLVGGGDTEAAIQQLDFQESQFSHVSLAGKALLQHLSGKELPGLVALQK